MESSRSLSSAHLRLSVGLNLDVLVGREWLPGRLAHLVPPNLINVDYLRGGVCHSLWLAEQEAPHRLSFPAGLRSGVRCVDGLLPPSRPFPGGAPLPPAWRRKAVSSAAASPPPCSSATALALRHALPAGAGHSRHATLPPTNADSLLPLAPEGGSTEGGPAPPPNAMALTNWALFVAGLRAGQSVLVKSEATGAWARGVIVTLELEKALPQVVIGRNGRPPGVPISAVTVRVQDDIVKVHLTSGCLRAGPPAAAPLAPAVGPPLPACCAPGCAIS